MLCSVSVLSLSCTSESDSVAVTEDQVVTVQRGDLTIDITAVGNLFFSDEEELAFEVSGTVGKVLVEIGDSVEEEQVLVKLDISEWEEQLDALERNVTTAERSLTSAERALATKLRSLLQAEINLKNAQIAVEDAQEALDEAKVTNRQKATSIGGTDFTGFHVGVIIVLMMISLINTRFGCYGNASFLFYGFLNPANQK